MPLDRLDALESRIRDLVKLVQELKKKNAMAEEELKVIRQRLAEKDDANRRWEQERVDISAFSLTLNPDVFCGQVPQTE